jgi:hypothetical protein
MGNMSWPKRPHLRRSVIAPPKESVTAKRPAKRSQGTDGELRYAAMRALGQDQDRITGEPPGNGRAPDQNPAEDDSPGRNVPRTEAKVSPQTVPLTKGFAEAALRFSRRKKQATRLPRGVRWKERRLPRICWAKSSQSAWRLPDTPYPRKPEPRAIQVTHFWGVFTRGHLDRMHQFSYSDQHSRRLDHTI